MKLLSSAAILLFMFISVATAQSVIVTNHKVRYKRPKPIAEHKQDFTVNYPRIKAKTPALSRKIEDAVSYKRVMNVDVKEELDEVQWLEGASWAVKYNKKGALALELSIEGSGAYPDGSTRTVIADTKTGERVTPAMSFTDLAGLAAMVKKAQKKEIAKAIRDINKDPERGDTDPSELFVNADFKPEDLDWFAISDRGVTFSYDYGFPHVIQAWQPAGSFFFTWKQLKPFIKPGSLLSRIAR